MNVASGGTAVEIEVVNVFEDALPVIVTKNIDDSVQDASGPVPDFDPVTTEVQCFYEVAPTEVQGVADLTMGIAGASAGVLSGVVLAGVGYSGLSAAGALLLIPLVWELWRSRRAEGFER